MKPIIKIKKYIESRKGYVPSLNEIAKHTGLHWGTVKDNVETLKQLKKIQEKKKLEDFKGFLVG